VTISAALPVLVGLLFALLERISLCFSTALWKTNTANVNYCNNRLTMCSAVTRQFEFAGLGHMLSDVRLKMTYFFRLSIYTYQSSELTMASPTASVTSFSSS
jgi:hypothetical protein